MNNISYNYNYNINRFYLISYNNLKVRTYFYINKKFNLKS